MTEVFAPPARSVAVLPFLDLSEKRDQEYFADGMAEELLDLLAKIPGLRVIGPHSRGELCPTTSDPAMPSRYRIERASAPEDDPDKI